jgi:uncharacterized membrane protein YjjB (DUF3815 family)
MTQFEILQIITGFLGSLAFAILFNIRGTRLIGASIGGFLSWALFVLLGFLTENEPLRYFIVALTISVYAEIMARILKTPTTTFHMTALIPLIPGGSLYYTMASVFEGNLSNFLDKAIYTLELAISLALGIVLVTAIARTVARFRKASNKS